MKFSIMDLRPANQNQPCDVTAAIAFIFWHGKALIAQRGDQEDFLPGYWELVGGQVEAGENTDKMRDRVARGFAASKLTGTSASSTSKGRLA